MKTFYSLIKVAPNNVAGDNVSIGIVLYDGNSIRYYFSEHKKKIATKLVENFSVNLNFVIKQLITRFQEINSDTNDLQLFSKFERFRNSNYFDYLNRYSNGLIQFSSPFYISDEIDDINFDKLINLIFEEQQYLELQQEDFKVREARMLVTEKLINPVREVVHTNYKFNNSNLPSIYFPFEMECIGMNGNLIGAKHLPFDKTKQTLDMNVSHYFTLISTLSNKYDKRLSDNDFFLISDEPSDIQSAEHRVWESVNSNELINVIPSEESGKVAELIIEKKATKFLV